MRLRAKTKGKREMTHHQYEMVKRLQRIWFLRRLFGKGWSQDIMTKQAEIELAGQAAAKNRPPIQDNDDPTIDGRSNDKENQ